MKAPEELIEDQEARDARRDLQIKEMRKQWFALPEQERDYFAWVSPEFISSMRKLF